MYFFYKNEYNKGSSVVVAFENKSNKSCDREISETMKLFVKTF